MCWTAKNSVTHTIWQKALNSHSKNLDIPPTNGRSIEVLFISLVRCASGNLQIIFVFEVNDRFDAGFQTTRNVC